MTTPLEVNDAQIAEWRHTGHPYKVIAAEIDRYALAALGLNSELNGVEITAIGDDLTAGPPPPVNLVAVGDLFYERDLADRVTAFLDRCLAAIRLFSNEHRT